MTRRLQHWLINAALLLGSILSVIAPLEVVLRLTGIDKRQQRTPLIYQTSTNPDISYELKPNLKETAFRATVTTNALGIRSPAPDPAKPSLALLGDSITFGYGLEDTETLGARVSSVLVDQYNIFNAAVPGYNLIQETATYQTKLSGLNPEVFVLVFYWNDLRDMTNAVLDDEGILRQPGWKPEDPRCNPLETGILGLLPGRCWLDLHSAIYRVTKKVASARQEQANLQAQREEFQKNPEEDSIDPKNLQRYQEIFTTLAKELPADQKKIFVIWPDKEFHAKTVPVLTQMAVSQGFRVVNLYDVFGNEAETLNWDTVHPSAKTVEKAAEVIGKVVLE